MGLDGFNMRKKIIIILSVALTLTIGTFLLIFLLGKNDTPKENVGEYRNIKIECISPESYTYDLGEYFVYNYKESVNENERIYLVNFQVDDGMDFYNRIIKKSKYYNADFDYKNDGHIISYGFLHDKLNYIKYQVYQKSVELININGSFTDPYDFNDLITGTEPITFYKIPGPILRKLDNKNPDLNTPTLWKDVYDIEISYDNIVKLYSDLPYDFAKIHDDYILIKAICYIDDIYDQSKLKDLFISENYVCKITKFNDTVRYEILDEYNK